MNKIVPTFAASFSLVFWAGGCGQKESNTSPTAADYDHLGITNPEYLSAASKRALEWPEIGNEWFIQFRTYDLKGDFAYEEGVVRRDPSAMIQVDGKYFVWYSRSTGETQGFAGDIENEKVFSLGPLRYLVRYIGGRHHLERRGISRSQGTKRIV